MTRTIAPEWRLQDRLGRALDFAEVSVQQMADELDVSRQTVGNYLHGRTLPSRAVLRVWALRCGVSFGWLLTGDGDDDAGVSPTATPTGGEVPSPFGHMSFAFAA